MAAFLAVFALAGEAHAQKPGATAKPATKAAKPAPKPAKKAAAPAKPKKATPKPAETEADAESPAASPAATEDAKPTGEGESQVKAAGTAATSAATPKKEATAEEDKEGIKTYHFGAIEVESRLKSPQLIYFLRRVRAEFDAGALGHRSFLGELSDTRNDSAFR